MDNERMTHVGQVVVLYRSRRRNRRNSLLVLQQKLFFSDKIPCDLMGYVAITPTLGAWVGTSPPTEP
jgi:hypothetical protein